MSTERIRNVNQLDLGGRTAIVTGGARGIGYAAARRILLSGGAVSIWDVDRLALEQAQAALSSLGEVHCATVELTLKPKSH